MYGRSCNCRAYSPLQINKRWPQGHDAAALLCCHNLWLLNLDFLWFQSVASRLLTRLHHEQKVMGLSPRRNTNMAPPWGILLQQSRSAITNHVQIIIIIIIIIHTTNLRSHGNGSVAACYKPEQQPCYFLSSFVAVLWEQKLEATNGPQCVHVSQVQWGQRLWAPTPRCQHLLLIVVSPLFHIFPVSFTSICIHIIKRVPFPAGLPLLFPLRRRGSDVTPPPPLWEGLSWTLGAERHPSFWPPQWRSQS